MNQPAKERPPNPKCAECSHPGTFHSKAEVEGGKRPCKAFGCICKDFDEPTKEPA